MDQRNGINGNRSRQWPLFLLLFCEDASETDFVGEIEKGSSNMATEKVALNHILFKDSFFIQII